MKKQKKGFSIIVEAKDNVIENTVYFEERAEGRVIYCNIYDDYFETTFHTKAVCHEQDEFSKKRGYELAFERCLEKRNREYDRAVKNITRSVLSLLSMKRKSIQIDDKFTKFIESLEN